MQLLKRHWCFHALQIIFVSLISGWILYQSFFPNSTLIISLAAIALMFLPFIFLWLRFSKKVLIAILFLTMAFNIDQTFFIREHNGGAAGLIVSLNGLVVFILYLIYFFETYHKRESNLHFFTTTVLCLLGLAMMATISLTSAPNRTLGLFELLELVKMISIFIYVKYAITHEIEFKFILKILLVGIVLQGAIGILQFVTGSSLNLTMLGGQADASMQIASHENMSRIGGTLGGPNSFAWYLDFILPIPLAIILLGRGKRNLSLNLIALCIGCIVLFMTLSRGGWLGMLFSSFIVLSYLITKLTPMKRFYTIIIMILLACIAFILMLGMTNPVRDRFLAEDGGSAYVRIPLMQVAVNIIKHHPMTGVGLNNYTLVHHNYDNTDGRVSTYFPYPVHNIFLQLGAEVGVIGLMFFIVFLICILYQAIGLIRANNSLTTAVALGLLVSLMGGMIQAQVENATIGSANLLPLWMLSGLIAGLWEKEKLKTSEYKEESCIEIG
ncbi:O-antigen ligase family protein [candidate division KSB1 bacterium]|nr:O-antigen ligase family protein [candidate division KSB1 bacterium]